MERIAVLGVADRELEDILQAPGSELAEEEEPAAEGPGDARREHAGSRDQVVPTAWNRSIVAAAGATP